MVEPAFKLSPSGAVVIRGARPVVLTPSETRALYELLRAHFESKGVEKSELPGWFISNTAEEP